MTNYYQGIISTVKEYPNCFFYINGDGFALPAKVCISNRVKTFESLKDDVTEALRRYTSCTGPVRNIYTPVGGTEITKLEELEDEASYVAAFGTNTHFRRLPAAGQYKDIKDRIRQARRGHRTPKTYPVVRHAADPKYRELAGRARTQLQHTYGIRLRCHVTGLGSRPAFPVAISYRDRGNLAAIFREIELSMDLSKPVQEIYKLGDQGGTNDTYTEVVNPADLDNGDHVVVVPRSQYLRREPYPYDGKKDFVYDTSPHTVQHYLHESFPTVKPLGKRRPHTQIGLVGDKRQADNASPRESLASRVSQTQGLRLKVHQNGKWSDLSTVVIQHRDRAEMKKIKREIQKSLNISPVYKIFRVGGDGTFLPIDSPKDLNMDSHVVVLTRMDYRRMLKRGQYTHTGTKDMRFNTAPHDLPSYLFSPFPSPAPLTCRHRVELATYRDYDDDDE